MARYIDADGLLARIELNYNDHQNICAFAMKDIIKTTPTVYNVDAVIAELKKKSYQEWCDSPKIVELKDAIDIVRNAGKECVE